ncbi:hypothetical protein LTR66_005437, partial [Elasticomyces elasticus]
LWHTIMAGKGAGRATFSSRARIKGLGGRDSGIGTERSSTASSASTEVDGSKAARVNDLDFEAMVLKPRGISLDSNSIPVSAFNHFGRHSPKGDRPTHYRSIKGIESTTVSLTRDEGFALDVIREYDSMNDYKVCGAEYAQYAVETLLKREVRNHRLPSTRTWMTERMIQLVAKADTLWEQPPILNPDVAWRRYAFDIRPDCFYWMSLQAFNPDYRKTVEVLVFVKQTRILCPYLTIESKKVDSSALKARNQVAAAAAIALYNRWKLKERRLHTTGEPRSEKHTSVLRHYGLTFTGNVYEFWCITPNPSHASASQTSSPPPPPTTLQSSNAPTSNWTGCHMRRVQRNACDTIAGVRELVDWINEIHRWGL